MNYFPASAIGSLNNNNNKFAGELEVPIEMSYPSDQEVDLECPFKNSHQYENVKSGKLRSWRIPWFVAINCCAQISLFAIASNCTYRKLMFIPDRRREYWRFLSYTLLHSDLSNLLLNISLQLIIGFCLETEQGHWRITVIYIAGGISGSIATYAFQRNLSLVGASAGVYSLLMSHIPHLVKNFTELPHRYLRVIALVIFCSSDVAFTSFHFIINNNLNPKISIVAHVAGGISGVCLGFGLYTGIKTQMHSKLIRFYSYFAGAFYFLCIYFVFYSAKLF